MSPFFAPWRNTLIASVRAFWCLSTCSGVALSGSGGTCVSAFLRRTTYSSTCALKRARTWSSISTVWGGTTVLDEPFRAAHPFAPAVSAARASAERKNAARIVVREAGPDFPERTRTGVSFRLRSVVLTLQQASCRSRMLDRAPNDGSQPLRVRPETVRLPSARRGVIHREVRGVFHSEAISGQPRAPGSPSVSVKGRLTESLPRGWGTRSLPSPHRRNAPVLRYFAAAIGLTGSGTLHSSMWPAGFLNHSSRR